MLFDKAYTHNRSYLLKNKQRCSSTDLAKVLQWSHLIGEKYYIGIPNDRHDTFPSTVAQYIFLLDKLTTLITHDCTNHPVTVCIVKGVAVCEEPTSNHNLFSFFSSQHSHQLHFSSSIWQISSKKALKNIVHNLPSTKHKIW